MTQGLPDAQLRKAVIPGKWSVFENIVHLAVYQHTFIKRLEQIQGSIDPVFERYTAETDPLFHDNCTQPTAEIMEDLVATREEIVKALTACTPAQLQRRGIHPVFGPMNMMQWAQFFLLHEAHHLFTVFKLAAELKVRDN
jgi:uncharacterized damage-inducible protein DinB